MIKIKYFIAALMAAITLNSCSDMFDDGSNRYITNPSLDEKVDSMFYINGILKGVQQAIDQNVLINELRGDLLTTTKLLSITPAPTSTILHTFTTVSSTTATTTLLTVIPR